MRVEHIRPLGDVLENQAARFGDKPLFIDQKRTVTYGDFNRRTAMLAGGFLRMGLRPGDRVVTYLPNSIELLEAYFGLAKAGIVTVFANPQLTEREVGHILADSGACSVITHPTLLEQVLANRSIAQSLQSIILVGDPQAGTVAFEGLTAGPAPQNLPALSPDDPVWIGYSSGTTGLPKGTLLTHRNVMWVASTVVEIAGLHSEDRVLTTLPLFHSYALNLCVLQVILAGATEWIHERFSPKAVLEAIGQHRITIFPGVPTMFNLLLNFPERQGYDWSSLRLCPSAGSIMPVKLMSDFQAALKVPILDGYGMTETSSYITVNRSGTSAPLGSCGMALPGCSVRVVDPSGRDVASGERGELICRGPNVTPWGYLNRPEETARASVNGWWHSGDIATMDEHGYVYIVDRLKDLIISGGYKIAPKEIEDVLLAHAAVQDAAVIGVPDEVKGEVPMAYVTLRRGMNVSDADLLTFCQASLAKYKMPVKIYMIAEIPKTASGKVKRFELRMQQQGRTG